ncbi:MAG: SDR family oxidoreductase [Pseudomonadota bacterium]
MKLENKVMVVSGGARDIGREVVLKLAREGARVVVNYYGSSDGARRTEEDVKDLRGESVFLQGNMTDAEDVGRLIDAGISAFGDHIDGLVNVTGGLVARKTLAEMDDEFFSHVIRLNLNSTFLLTKACVPHMSSGGSIVNLASQAGRDGGGPGASAYAASKGAIMTFTRSMAKELGPQNIRVNALCPGVISTTFHDTFSKDEVRKNIAAGTPLRREGQPSEVADIAAYLLSGESSFLTGVNLDTNGGLLFS